MSRKIYEVNRDLDSSEVHIDNETKGFALVDPLAGEFDKEIWFKDDNEVAQIANLLLELLRLKRAEKDA